MADVTKRATGSWHVALRGMSARTGGQDWREAIRDAVNQTYPNAPFSPPPEGTRFRVDIVFRLPVEEATGSGVDLDNLAEPVLDTVFTSGRAQPPTGAVFPVNDTWVFRLDLEKLEVASTDEAGLDLTIEIVPRDER